MAVTVHIVVMLLRVLWSRTEGPSRFQGESLDALFVAAFCSPLGASPTILSCVLLTVGEIL